MLDLASLEKSAIERVVEVRDGQGLPAALEKTRLQQL